MEIACQTGIQHRDHSGARRLSVMQKYVADQLNEPNNSVLGLGGFLAGFAFEKSGDADQALHYYDTALQFPGFDSLRAPTRALLASSTYRTPRLSEIEQDPMPAPLDDANEGELVVIVGYGRVPHKISNRIPVGLALTLFASDLNPGEASAANKLAARRAGRIRVSILLGRRPFDRPRRHDERHARSENGMAQDGRENRGERDHAHDRARRGGAGNSDGDGTR